MILHGLQLEEHALAELCGRHRVAKLWLFGSVLRNDFRPDSDVDILVAFKPNARIGFIELATFEEELETLIGRKVDLVPALGLKRAVRETVWPTRRLLYAV